MNTDDHDPDIPLVPDLTRLERELARLRPMEPSPELLGRWESLGAFSGTGRTRRRWRMVPPLGLATVAACLLIVWIRHTGERSKPVRQPDRPLVADRQAGSERGKESEAPRYSLLSYRQALAQSPAELDSLLARDSAVSEPPHRILAFGRARNGSVPNEGDN